MSDLEPPLSLPEQSSARPLPPWKLIMLGGLGLLVVVVAAGGLWYSSALGGTSEGEPTEVIVQEGASARAIAEALQEAGVIRSAFAFRIHLRLNGEDTVLKPGAYQLRAGLGVDGALEALREGIPLPVFRFTIPEGMTLIEMGRILERDTHISNAEFKAALRGAPRPQILPAGVSSLEGLLFPDTYDITEKVTAEDVVARMRARFEEKTAEIDFSKAEKLGVSKYEAVVIASLIEREARIQRDRPKVSSVIHNRLAIPMRLQIDATVQYALLQRDGKYTEVVLYRDLEINSPHNTYRIDGLPPTPIASPGMASLRAALNPESTDFLFYVACGEDGGHAFGKTSGDHQRNIQRCR